MDLLNDYSENYNAGWISIYRSIQSHWLWDENRVFSKLEAWLDILLTVNHKKQKTVIKNEIFIINRGESINSLDTWASRWKWNKSKVRRFLKLLENDSMIELKNEKITTRLTVCNYDSYQVKRNADETQMKHKRNADETQMTPNNNDNNINNENKENNIIPLFEDFLYYAVSKKENICKEALKLKYDAWILNDWKDGNNKKIKNWKIKLNNTLPYIKEKSTKTDIPTHKRFTL